MLDNKMIVTCVHVYVKPENIDDFIEATIINHKESIQESGNLRFDVLQDASDPAKFVLYEAYESSEDVAEHKKTAHYQNWRDTVASMMAKPREGVKHNVISPKEPALW